MDASTGSARRLSQMVVIDRRGEWGNGAKSLWENRSKMVG